MKQNLSCICILLFFSIFLLNSCKTNTRNPEPSIFPRENLAILMQAKFDNLKYHLKEKKLPSHPDHLNTIQLAVSFLTPEQKKSSRIDEYTKGCIFTLVAPRSYIAPLAHHGYVKSTDHALNENNVVLELPNIFLEEHPYTVAENMDDYFGQFDNLGKGRLVTFSHEEKTKIAARIEEDLKRNDILPEDQRKYKNELVFRSFSIPLTSFWVHVVDQKLVDKIKIEARGNGWFLKAEKKEGDLFSLWIQR